jgi:hypothetical protein
MTWVKVDDDMPWHRKFRKAGDLRALCLALDLTGICHCAKYATDGFLPAADLPGVLDVIPRNRRTAVLGLLVEIGRWEIDDQRAGYWIRNYLKYNPSASEAEKERQRRAENTRRWRAKHRGDQSPADSVTNDESTRDDSVTDEYHGPRAGAVGPSPVVNKKPEGELLVNHPPRDPSPDPGAASPSSAIASGDADSAAQPHNPPPRLSAQLKAEAAARTLAAHGIDNGNVPPPPATRPDADPDQFEAERRRQLAALQATADPDPAP